MSEQKTRTIHCIQCGDNVFYSEDEFAFEDKHMELPCACNSGKKAKDCHPEFFDADCASCEVKGEYQDD